MKMILYFAGSEGAATPIEYALITGLISLIVMGGATLVGTGLTSKFSQIGINLS